MCLTFDKKDNKLKTIHILLILKTIKIMKQLLLFMSMIFLLISCQDISLISQGELREVNEKSATVGNLTYQTANGTTDFLLDEKLIVNGETAYVYADGNKIYVSKLNLKERTAENTKGIYIAYWILLMFVCAILFASIIVYFTEGGDIRKFCLIATIVSTFPLILLILGWNYPEKFPQLTPFVPRTYLDFGVLTDKTKNSVTINGTTWNISKNHPNNSKNRIEQGKTYAIASSNGKLLIYETDDAKKIQRDIAYSQKNPQNCNTGDVTIIISLCIINLILLIILYIQEIGQMIRSLFKPRNLLKRRKNKAYNEISDDERNGYGGMRKE